MPDITHILTQQRLALCDVKADEEGVKSGWVVNGEWRLVRKNGEWLAKDGRFIVNRWPVTPESLCCVPCPKGTERDYNAAIYAAAGEYTGRPRKC